MFQAENFHVTWLHLIFLKGKTPLLKVIDSNLDTTSDWTKKKTYISWDLKTYILWDFQITMYQYTYILMLLSMPKYKKIYEMHLKKEENWRKL